MDTPQPPLSAHRGRAGRLTAPGHHFDTSRSPTREAHSESMKIPMTATATAERAPSRLLNRELSWLEYDARVLELAEDPAVRCSNG